MAGVVSCLRGNVLTQTFLASGAEIFVKGVDKQAPKSTIFLSRQSAFVEAM